MGKIKGVLLILFSILATFAKGQINADFFSNNVEACGSLQTTFFDQSTSDKSIISWSWNLGGNTSNKQNPSAIFNEPGSYTICLTVTDVDGKTDTECKDDFITILPAPQPNFTSDIATGCAPQTITFTNTSTSEYPVTSYLWDVGGSTGIVTTNDVNEKVTTTYSAGGNYTISLTAQDENGCEATFSQPGFIVINQIPQPNISFDSQSACELPWVLDFQNTNANPNVSYFWDFGNGETYEGIQPPSITYSSIGKFDITIYMESGSCKDTLVLTEFIDTDATAKFSVSQPSVCVGSAIGFMDESVVEASSVFWDFGDGTTSTESNPSHIFAEPGCYTITLSRIAGECSDTEILNCIEVFELPEFTVDIENQFACKLPANITLNGNTTTDGIFTWNYENEDGSFESIGDEVNYSINKFGAFSASVVFTDNNGCKAQKDNLDINLTPFEVSLPVSGPDGCAPLTFSLQDSITTSANIADYQWSIPALNLTSPLSQPIFTIQDTGRYDVQLIATNELGCVDTAFIENYIGVGNIPEIDFSAFPREDCINDPKYFFDESEGITNEWFWEFGNNSTADVQNPTYYYGAPGIYDVTLHAAHNGCWDSLIYEDYITILEPVSLYGIDYNCDDPYTVAINNVSVGADSLFWTIRLSETDSLILTDSIIESFTFPDRGIYTISHYSKSFTTGCEHERTDTITIVDPIANYTLDTLRACAPASILLSDASQDVDRYTYFVDGYEIDSTDLQFPILNIEYGGIYSTPKLVITDIHECKDSITLSDSLRINQLDASIFNTDVLCVPDTAVFMEESIDLYGYIIDRHWLIGDTLAQFTTSDTSILVNDKGVYSIQYHVEDDWGCKDSLLLPEGLLAIELLPDFSYDTLGCTWAPIHFEALNTTSTIDEYYWDFGDGTFGNGSKVDHVYTAEGTYSVCLTMNDSRGCGKTVCKDTIIEILDPVADFSGDPTFATCPPLLTTFTNNSQNSSDYIWEFGDNSGVSFLQDPGHVYTTPGRFDVMLIAIRSEVCQDTITKNEFVKVEGPSGTFESLLPPPPNCLPISVELRAQSDGFYNYIWDFGNGVLDTVPNLVIADTTTIVYEEVGVFTPKLILIDSIGCSRSFSGDPLIINYVELDFTKPNDILCGVPNMIEVTNQSISSTLDVTYTWLINNEVKPYDSIYLFESLVPGNFDVSLIAEYDECIDTLSIDDFITVGSIPEISFDINTTQLCKDVEVDFINTSSNEFGEFIDWEWDFGDGSISNEENPSHKYIGVEDQNIRLKGYTEFGCENEFEDGFKVLPSTISHVPDDKLICIGDKVRIDGWLENLLPGGSYYWESDNTLSCTDCYSPIASPTEDTEYVFVGVHPNGCESRDTIAVTVIQVPGPDPEISFDPIICLGDSTIITIDNFDTNDYEYEWQSFTSTLDCYANCEEITINPDSTSSIFLTVVNEYGCIQVDTVEIMVESEFEDVLAGFKGICEGNSTEISVLAGSNPVWKANQDIICTNCPVNTVAPLSTTSYFVTVQSPEGCYYEDSIEVIVVPPNSAYAGEDQQICSGETIRLTSTGVGTSLWSPEELINDPDSEITEATLFDSTYIKLTTVFDECIQSDSLHVNVLKHSEIEAVGDSVCFRDTASVSAFGLATKYQWFDEENMFGLDSTESIYSELTKDYMVVGQYRTCIPDTEYVQVFVHPEIDVKFEEDYQVIHQNNTLQIEPEYDENRNYSFQWYPNTGLNCNQCPDPIIAGIMENMNYELVIEDLESHCVESVPLRIGFSDNCTKDVFHFANIFSPNGDGVNDEFKMITSNPEEFISMQIFDRWGALLFETDDVYSGWNGNFNGSKVNAGVYVYKVVVICPQTNEQMSIMGTITVI